MKKFLIVSFTLLLVALILSGLVFWWINTLPAKNVTAPETMSVTETSVDQSTDLAVPSEGIPLNEVPLGDTQKSVLESVGVDVNTFVITPAMQQCAKQVLGEKRMSEIIAGDAPGALETAKLIPCTRVE